MCDSSSSLPPSSSPHTWRFLALLPFIFPLFSTLVLALFLSFSILPHLPFPLNASPYHLLLSFHPFYLADPLSFSPSPHHPYWSYITLTHSTPPSTSHVPSLPSCLPLISSSTPSLSSPSPSHSSRQSARTLTVTTVVASCWMSMHHDLLTFRRFVSRGRNKSCHEGASQEGTHTSREFQIQLD